MILFLVFSVCIDCVMFNNQDFSDILSPAFQISERNFISSDIFVIIQIIPTLSLTMSLLCFFDLFSHHHYWTLYFHLHVFNKHICKIQMKLWSFSWFSYSCKRNLPAAALIPLSRSVLSLCNDHNLAVWIFSMYLIINIFCSLSTLLQISIIRSY